MPTWLDSAIGWDKDFNEITTCLPWDEAVDQDESNIDGYFDDNFNTEHLKFKPGTDPVNMKIRLPSPAQFQSIVPLLSSIEERGEEAMFQAAYKLFEMCVRFPGQDKMKPAFREGFKRLVEPVMEYMVQQSPAFVQIVGAWILEKYMLGDEAKKQ